MRATRFPECSNGVESKHGLSVRRGGAFRRTVATVINDAANGFRAGYAFGHWGRLRSTVGFSLTGLRRGSLQWAQPQVTNLVAASVLGGMRTK